MAHISSVAISKQCSLVGADLHNAAVAAEDLTVLCRVCTLCSFSSVLVTQRAGAGRCLLLVYFGSSRGTPGLIHDETQIQ